jgi:hypothetical protein
MRLGGLAVQLGSQSKPAVWGAAVPVSTPPRPQRPRTQLFTVHSSSRYCRNGFSSGNSDRIRNDTSRKGPLMSSVCGWLVPSDPQQLPSGPELWERLQLGELRAYIFERILVAKPPKVGYVIHRNPPMSIPYCLP